MTSLKLVKIEYVNRDACNYKVYGESILGSSLSEEALQQLIEKLKADKIIGTEVVIEQLGLPSLLPEQIEKGTPRYDLTCFCEIESIRVLAPQEKFEQNDLVDTTTFEEFAHRYELLKDGSWDCYDPQTVSIGKLPDPLTLPKDH